MVIVIPLETTTRLVQMAQAHQLNLPVPLSSGCASYLSPEEMDTILDTLTPLSSANAVAADLMSELKDYREQRNPVVPCDGI
ncbi:MAG: hypothetical protein AAF609_25985 [Cyanobacteria bacterium P01_C01_bin.120]